MKPYIKHVASLLMLATTSSAHSAVYVSSDSITPLTQHQLTISQLEESELSRKAIRRAVQSSEYMMGQMMDFNREIQLRADSKMEQVYKERRELDQARIHLADEQNQLVSQQNELATKQLVLEQNYQEKHAALVAKNAATQAAIYHEQSERNAEILEQQNMRQTAFLNQQSAIQKETISLQKQVAENQDQLLIAQLNHNAPSNVVVISSKQASNVKAKVSPSDAKKLDNIAPTVTKAPLVNMNRFIEQILPEEWNYDAPKGSDNKMISIIQGKNWNSIITTLGVQHPYLDILINVKERTLVIKDRHSQLTNSIEPTRSWQITKTKTLRQTIEDFGIEANWQVIWDTDDVDYPIVANGVLHGNFSGEKGVINQLMASTASQEFPLVARWSPNAVRIERRKSTKKH
ncbi:TcpQ domain-containing protein [Vibrio tubiashii]|uniref:TcpQ domain-containing protein n=1 Tax=Vibrio tubiashii TaxID=29498 RepID=UPI001EFE7CBF|nr:TcpQ domain-containing protein [Vibrio tubiashii]MCG9578618.1 TcpQ domain-containing protein [Vibrio tubiashii]